MTRAFQAGIAALAAALLAAPAAQAATVTIGGGTEVRFTESGSETNRVFVAYSAATDTYTVRDFASNVTPSGLCVAVNASTASCPGAGITSIDVSTDARDDTILLDAASIPPAVSSDLNGGPNDDFVHGALGRDDMNGGSGRDLMDGDLGADEINGGSGTDSLFYSNRATPVFVTVGSGNDNDGNELDFSPGILRDTVRGDIEIVFGGAAGDTIIGDNTGETLAGGEGPDTLVGNGGGDSLFAFGGDDIVFGGNGNDLVRGALGNDRLFGGPDGDQVAGGPDNDAIWGDTGADAMKGKGGIDVIRARDGTRDRKIKCGPGPNGAEFAKRDKRLDPKPRTC
jgi:Ca2+-binding RTX toxin-like protein